MKTFREFILEADDPYAKYAEELGFKRVRTTGKHFIYRHPSGAQVPSPKSGSDFRGPLNFRRDLRSALTNKGVDWKPKTTQPIQTPTKEKPSKVSSDARNRYRQGLNVTRVPVNQQQSSLSQLPKPVTTVVTPKPKPSVPTSTQPSLIQRMAAAYTRMVRGLSPADKSTYGNQALTQATGAGSKGLKYVPNVNKPIPARPSGGGGAIGAPIVQPIDTPISPGYSDVIQNYARSRAARSFNRRGGV